jgi:hypothetical protein
MSNAEILRRELDERKRAEEKAILLAEQARRSFTVFFRHVWPIVEPGIPLIPGWYLGCIDEHLQAVFMGQIKDLAICVPPGSAKTTKALEAFPAWGLVQNPGLRFLCGANSEKLTIKSSGRCRDIIRSDWYQKHYPHVQISEDNDRKDWYDTTAHGFRKTFIVNGLITGERGDFLICFPAGTPILTTVGQVPIERIVADPENYSVASFDHSSETVRYSKPAAVFTNQSDRLVEVTLSNGTVLTCTADHPIYVPGDGYKPAEELIPGAEVLTHEGVRKLWYHCGHHKLAAESRQNPEVLQPEVHERTPEIGEYDDLRDVREVFSPSALQAAERDGLLLKKMRVGWSKNRDGEGVPGLRRQHVHPRPETGAGPSEKILHQEVSGCDAGHEQHTPMQGLWGAVLRNPGTQGAWPEVLLQGVLAEGVRRREQSPLEGRRHHEKVRGMRQGIHLPEGQGEENQVVREPGMLPRSAVPCKAGSRARELRKLQQTDRGDTLQEGETESLLKGVCERQSLGQYQGREERTIRPRRVRVGLPARMDHQPQAENPQEGREPVPLVLSDASRGRESPLRPPCGLQQGKPFTRQPDGHVPILPRPDARRTGATEGVDGDTLRTATVLHVRPVAGQRTVYNIELRPDHNYFASGVLVHNCDDPNDAQKVQSAANRNAVNEWYDTAAWSRVRSLKDSHRIMIAQRTHRNDLIGHCIERHGYTPLVLPEEFDPARRCTTVIFSDPRTEKGELLRPEIVGPDEISRAKLTRGYQCMFNQDPSDEENAFYKPHYFQHRWRRHPHTPGLIVLERDENDRYEFSLSAATLFTTCDAAADAKTSSDHTALLLFAASPRGDLLVLDGFHERLDIPDQPELLARANAKWPGVTAWGIEAVGSNRAMFQFAKKMFLNAVPMNIKGEKLVKAQPAIIRASQGGIWLPEDNAVPGFDVPGLLEELVRFTGQAGGQDDRADCIAQGCHMLPTLPTMRGAIGTPKAVSVLSAPRLPKPGTGPRISRAPLAMPRVINVK